MGEFWRVELGIVKVAGGGSVQEENNCGLGEPMHCNESEIERC